MTAMTPTVRYLSDSDVARAMPPLERAVELAEEALVARAEGRAHVPPKPSVFFGGDAFANAMPVALHAAGTDTGRAVGDRLDSSAPETLLGCKWIALQPENPARDLPTVTGLMIVCDGETGMPVCIMSAARLTAVRTAAVSAACCRAWVSRDEPIAFVGAGEQAHAHLRVLARLGYHTLRFVGRRHEPRERLRKLAKVLGVGGTVAVMDSVEEAIPGAAAIVTGLPIGLRGQEIDTRLVREDAVMLPLDYASSIGADLARTAVIAATDDVDQFEAVAPEKLGADYPLATEWTGNAIRGPRPAGRLLAQNLGNASSDILLAAEIAWAADQNGIGIELPR